MSPKQSSADAGDGIAQADLFKPPYQPTDDELREWYTCSAEALLEARLKLHDAMDLISNGDADGAMWDRATVRRMLQASITTVEAALAGPHAFIIHRIFDKQSRSKK